MESPSPEVLRAMIQIIYDTSISQRFSFQTCSFPFTTDLGTLVLDNMMCYVISILEEAIIALAVNSSISQPNDKLSVV